MVNLVNFLNKRGEVVYGQMPMLFIVAQSPKARKKLSWRVFDSLLKDAVQLAYKVWPDSPEYTWHGMTAIAFDGSKYNLPASREIRETFDPEKWFRVSR